MPAEFVEKLPEDLLLRPAAWPAGCGALMTTRAGGMSHGRYASLNLKAQPGEDDDALAVMENRRRFGATISALPVWLDQVHGTRVVCLDASDVRPGVAPLRADASITTTPGVACTVLVADCLPVLFATRDGRAVGAAHAGWRGLAGGVLEAAVQALGDASGQAPREVVAWLGACIGPARFEVGEDVRRAFADDDPACFRALPETSAAGAGRKWMADLPALARARLRRLGLVAVSAAGACTAGDAARFYSYRRDGPSGRMAAAAWIGAL